MPGGRGSGRGYQPFDLPKKRPVVGQACFSCRKFKVKVQLQRRRPLHGSETDDRPARRCQQCDAARPKCSTCNQKNRECAYEFADDGRSRNAALRARLEYLQQQLGTQSAPGPAGSGVDGPPSPPLPIEGGGAVDSSASSASPSLPPTPASLPFGVPAAAVTERAVDNFFSCSGKLFHVFSREQVEMQRDIVRLQRRLVATPISGMLPAGRGRRWSPVPSRRNR